MANYSVESVGMRPLERSIEKLDDFRRNKLSELITGSGGDVATGIRSAKAQPSGGSVPSLETLKSSFVRKSAASMLKGKRRVPAAGLERSDHKKIGCTLQDLVSCILVTFEKEHIVAWRGKDYKPPRDDGQFFAH